MASLTCKVVNPSSATKCSFWSRGSTIGHSTSEGVLKKASRRRCRAARLRVPYARELSQAAAFKLFNGGQNLRLDWTQPLPKGRRPSRGMARASADGPPAKKGLPAGAGSALELESNTPSSRGSDFNGVFLLLIANFALYVAHHVVKLQQLGLLLLNHARPQWWQFITSAFCHANWEHLSQNMFLLYIFGKLVEEEEGSVGVWAYYLVTGASASFASLLLLPRGTPLSPVISCGASGAVFGLFAISVLVKLRYIWNWRKLLEVIILGQFVVKQVLTEAQMSATMGAVGRSGGVNHIAHLAGALAGAAFIFLLSRLPSTDGSKATR